MPESHKFANGSLVVVGTGIRIVGQLTTEAIAWMKGADRLLYVAADRLAEEVLRQLNPAGAESMARFYAEGKPRVETYRAMVDRVLECLRLGMSTVVVSYGHPGVFGDPFHEAVRRARAEGYPARMLPAISALDCLFADLGIDPATHGLQSYDATDFLLRRRSLDPTVAAVLWQVGQVCDPLAHKGRPRPWGLPLPVERLAIFHPPDHVCCLYQAALIPGVSAVVTRTTIRDLPREELAAMATLYVPPSESADDDPVLSSKIRAMIGRDASHRPEETPGSSIHINSHSDRTSNPRGLDSHERSRISSHPLPRAMPHQPAHGE